MRGAKGVVVELVYEFTFRAELGGRLLVGRGPTGTRAVAAVSGGTAEGARISGTIVGPGADWVVLGDDGYGQIDVRLQIQTSDGAVLLLTYTGSLERSGAVGAALAGGGDTEFADQYFRTHIRIECGDERYRWVNRTLFVGEGRIAAGGAEYRVYRLA